MIKKKKPGEPEPQAAEETAAAESAENPAQKPEDPAETAEKDDAAQTPQPSSENEADTDAGKTGNKQKGQTEKEKVISEQEFFKLYLQQTMEELKKTKAEAEETRKQLENAQALSQRMQEKLKSLNDEYENYRRRTTTEKEALADEAVSKAVTPLLPALDNLERAMPFAETNPESFRQGVEMTLKQLTDGFKALQVEEIPAEGAAFDPSFHNAVMHVEDEALPENTVTEVFQKGYRIGDRVIRHAMVKVAN